MSKSRIAIVGGASSGLGFAVAEELLRQGKHVVIVSRSEERIAAAAEQLRSSTDGRVAGVAADLAAADGPARVVEATRLRFGEPEIVVTNAGGPPSMPAVDAGAGDLVAAAELLLLPVQRFLALCLPAMRASGWGRLVAVTSIAVREPQPGLVLSNTLRAGLTGYLKSVSDEVAADGVTINSVLPGYTATDRLLELAEATARRTGTTVDEVMEGWAVMAPVKRLLEPAEVAAAAAFLCSDSASGITGHALPVDGGFGRCLL
ncbi:MAG: SDR family oxidoreductase [Thermoanaerobaculales bacterium]|nr:SDR family oxidoreductase [Thermoanaerobaculales bacterium]